MLIFVVAIIVFLLSGALYAGVMEPIFAAFAGFDVMDRACPMFCDIQTDVEGLTGWDIIKFWDRSTLSETSLDKLKQTIDPKAMGCYCGVSERSGKYIHIYGDAVENRIEEFHITEQNPAVHLKYKATDSARAEFDHTGGLKDCEDRIEEANGFTGLEDLEDYEGCIIFSINDETENCVLRGYEEGSALWNKKGHNLVLPMTGSSESIGDADQDSPITINIGETIKIENNRPNHQRILLRRYWKGKQPFELYAPVVCMSETIAQDPETEFDQACAKYCGDQEMAFWSSGCSDTVHRDFDELPGDYIDEGQDFCPEENEEPMCSCVVEKEYFWNVDEDYKPIEE